MFCNYTFFKECAYVFIPSFFNIIHQKRLLQKPKNGVRWMFKTLCAWTVGTFRIFTVLLSMQSVTFTGWKCFQGWSVDEHELHLQKYMWTWLFNDLLSFNSLWAFWHQQEKLHSSRSKRQCVIVRTHNVFAWQSGVGLLSHMWQADTLYDETLLVIARHTGIISVNIRF